MADNIKIKSEASSDSDSDVTVDCSPSKFDPMKLLYSSKVIIPNPKAPVYNNLAQYISAQERSDVIPIGQNQAVVKRAEMKKQAAIKAEKELIEMNERRFTEVMTQTTKKPWISKDLLHRTDNMKGPLATLKNCMNTRIRVKVVTRGATEIRGHMIGNLEAFDKQWNLALSDVVETWRRKTRNKTKIPPALGTPCPFGTAALRAHIPQVTELQIGPNIMQCTRHLPQIMVRGEHVVLINILKDT